MAHVRVTCKLPPGSDETNGILPDISDVDVEPAMLIPPTG